VTEAVLNHEDADQKGGGGTVKRAHLKPPVTRGQERKPPEHHEWADRDEELKRLRRWSGR
jgi:hypothetical protein